MAVFLLLVTWVSCGLVAMSVANAKDCNGINWLLGGFLFGPIGVIGAAGLPDRKLRRTMRLMAEAQGVDVDGRGPNAPEGNTDPMSDEAVEAQRRRMLGG